MDVTLNDGNIIHIEKLPLGKYAELLQVVEELPKQFKEFDGFGTMTTNDFIQILPKMLGKCLPDFIRIIPIATNLSPEQVQALGPDEMIDILVAVYTVNNYQKVYEKLKKILPQPKEKTPTTSSEIESGSSETS